jgi:hypothetical protein
MLILDSFTSSVNGACGRHERHDSAGMRLVTAASRWRSSVLVVAVGTIYYAIRLVKDLRRSIRR